MSEPLLLSMIAVFGIAVLFYAPRPALAAAVLIANLLACSLISDAIKDGYNSVVLACIDLVAASLLLLVIDPEKRWQVALPATYVFALCCHGVYHIGGPALVSMRQYWWALYIMAWGQVCFVAIWSGIDIYGVLRRGTHPLRRLYTCRGMLRSRISGEGK